MDIYNRKIRWKYALLLLAIFIGLSSMMYTNYVVRELSQEERKNVRLWAEAIRQLAEADMSEKDFSFLLDVIQNNRTVPAILTDDAGEIVSWRNLDSSRVQDPAYLQAELKTMKSEKEPIICEFGDGDRNYIYYRDSVLLTKLSVYPYVQMVIIMLFIFLSYVAFSFSRRAEQNKVWLGLSKETAHQLGTPTSSLLAWVELLKAQEQCGELAIELEKDVQRLVVITDRFSKIGSMPQLREIDLNALVDRTVNYLRNRVSNKVQFDIQIPPTVVYAKASASLLEWVIENLCKNAVDALEGPGNITVSLRENSKFVLIDVTDTGKGIPKSKFKTVFKPGYTTKKRGWGLGLSLAKRIIEQYHSGKIYVYASEINKGTTFRVLLNK